MFYDFTPIHGRALIRHLLKIICRQHLNFSQYQTPVIKLFFSLLSNLRREVEGHEKTDRGNLPAHHFRASVIHFASRSIDALDGGGGGRSYII